jgi:pilus assembly protein CpaE
MPNNPSCIFYSETNAELQSYAALLEADGTVEFGGVVTADPSELLDEVRRNRPDLVVADLGHHPDGVLDLLDKLPSPRPRLLVIGPNLGEPILRAMRMGVREYFDRLPSEEDLRRAIQRIAAEITPESTPVDPARIVAVMGAKGGVGATVVACQLAACLRFGGARTVVVDLNLPMGDVALHFDVQPSYTLANIARESDRLDGTYLRTLLQGPPDGVQILAAPIHAEEAELVQGRHVVRVLELLRHDFDWVIIDISRTWSEPTMRALDLADAVLLVTLMDVPTLHHARKQIALLERLGHASRRLRLVANRCSSLDAVSERDLSAFLDRGPDFRIPNDYPTALAGVNRGRSLVEIAPRTQLARAFAELTQALHGWCGVEVPAAKSGNAIARAVRGLFRSV